jgi:hypothetical protein
MRLENGIPIEVSDKGAWMLDEKRILSDAEEASGIKLTWMHSNRSKRWRKAPILAILRPNNEWSWCMAKVAPAACDFCGVNIGKLWTGAPGTPDRAWKCGACPSHK